MDKDVSELKEILEGEFYDFAWCLKKLLDLNKQKEPSAYEIIDITKRILSKIKGLFGLEFRERKEMRKFEKFKLWYDQIIVSLKERGEDVEEIEHWITQAEVFNNTLIAVSSRKGELEKSLELVKRRPNLKPRFDNLISLIKETMSLIQGFEVVVQRIDRRMHLKIDSTDWVGGDLKTLKDYFTRLNAKGQLKALTKLSKKRCFYPYK